MPVRFDPPSPLPYQSALPELQDGSTHLGFPVSNDVSTAHALAELDGWETVTADQFMRLFRAGSDYGQMTHQEWREVREWVQANHGRLDAKSRELFAALDEMAQLRGHAAFGFFSRFDPRDIAGWRGQKSVLFNAEELRSIEARLSAIAAGRKVDDINPEDKDLHEGHRTAWSNDQASVIDLSVESAIERRFPALIENRQITAADFTDVLRAAADYGQINLAEWRQVSDFVRHNYGSLTDEARAMFTRLDAAIQAKGRVAFEDREVLIKGQELAKIMGELRIRG